MMKYVASAAILVGLYHWTSQHSQPEAAAGITLLAAACIVTVLGLSRG